MPEWQNCSIFATENNLFADMDIQEYIEKYSTQEDEVLQFVNHNTHTQTINPRMLSGQIEGRLLSMLSKMIRPKRILELGTFTGYSALCLAEGLQKDGILHTIEHNDELEDMIRQHLSMSPLGKQIVLHIGDAKAILQGMEETFDLVFMDADKREYTEYYELVFPRLRQGGYILADNTLWDGHIVDTAYDKDKQTIGLRQFNETVAQDERVEQVILPVRDGLTIIRKR